MGSLRGLGLILLAALLAAAAGLGFYMKMKAAGPAPTIQTVPLVVASTDLKYGTKLEPQHLKVVDFPTAAVPAAAFSVLDSVLGHTTKVFLEEGEPILALKLSSKGGGLSVSIPESMRASSVNVDEISGVSGFILPGDHVDVIVTIDNVDRPGNTVARTILQNVEVLAAGLKTEAKNNKPVEVQAVTLLVDPSGAEELALGMHQGKIHLVLRNPGDASIALVPPKNTGGMMSGGVPAAPRPATPKRAPVVYSPAPPPPPAAQQPKPAAPTFTVIKDGKIQEQASPTEKPKADAKP